MATDISFASNADLVLSEGDSGTQLHSIQVLRTGSLTAGSSISWELRWSDSYNHPTALDFADGVIPSGVLSFAAGESSKNIVIRLAGDTIPEANELFYLLLNTGTAVGVNSSQISYVSGEIANDDDWVGQTQATAQALSVNSYTTGAIEKVNDQDWYAISMVAGQRYALGLAGTTNQGLLPTFQLLDVSGNQVANAMEQTGLGFTPSDSGTYYLKVQARAEGASTGNFSLVAYTQGDDIAGDASTLATLATYPEASGLIELVSDNHDVDWYTVSLTANHAYSLNLIQASAGVALGQNLGLQLLDGSTNHLPVTLNNLMSGAVNGLDAKNYSFTPSVSGNYYVAVSGTVSSSFPGFYFVGLQDNSLPYGDNGYQIRALSNSVIEGDANTTPYLFEVIRDNSASAATINWSVTGLGSNPTDASDFTGQQSGTLSFQAGESAKRIALNVAGDLTTEPTETFKVTLSTPSSGIIATGYAQANGTVRNDDGATGTSDYLTGSNEADTVNGGDGDDVIAGRAGNDSLLGGTGIDIVMGGDGDDTLLGGAGNDTLQGGYGIDKIDFTGSITDYVVTADPARMQYLVTDSVPGRDGTDTVVIGGEILRFANNAEYEIAFQGNDPALAGCWLATLSPGNDVFDFGLISGGSRSQISWTSANGSNVVPFIGNFSSQSITRNGVTLAPYTLRDPYGGTDTVKVPDASSPTDLTFWSGPTNDYVTFAGNATTPFIWNLSPNAGNDTVVGGTNLATIDFFFDDTLSIELTGHHGVLALGPNASVDYTDVNRWRFWGGDFNVKTSANNESFEVWANNVNIDLTSGGADQIYFTGWKSSNASITGLGADDSLNFSVAEFGTIVSTSMLQLSYEVANNTTHVVLNARDGKVANIHLQGGQYEIDHLNYDVSNPWNNSVTFKLVPAGRNITGTIGNDSIVGTDGADTIFGLAGNDTVLGLGGNDYIDPGAGSDSVNGGAGDDYIYAGGGDIGINAIDDQADTIDGGLGTDWAVYDYRFRGINSSIQFHVTEYGTNPVAEFTQQDPVNGKTDVLRNIEGIVVHGGEGNDVLYGSTRSDNFIGNDGNDTLYGLDGDDMLNGAAGNDSTAGGKGNDYIQKGGDGNDTVDGGEGFDAYHFGFDWVKGAGINFQSSWSGNGTYVQLLPGGFQDTVTGIEQILIVGTDFNDVITGDASNNGLEGNNGNDQLLGRTGNDTLTGGAGNDILDGGEGADTAIYRGIKSAYAINWDSSTVTVTDLSNGNASGTDTLSNIEFLQFNDQTVNLSVLKASPPVTVRVTPSQVSENSTEALTYTFTRSAGTTNSTLSFNVGLSGSAELGQDYTVLSDTGVSPELTSVTATPNIEWLKLLGNASNENASSISTEANGGLMLTVNSTAGSITTSYVAHLDYSGNLLKKDTMMSVGGNTFINAGWSVPQSQTGDYFVVGQTYATQLNTLNNPYPSSGDAFIGLFNTSSEHLVNVSSTAATDKLTAVAGGRDTTQYPYVLDGPGFNVLYTVGSTGSDATGWNATLSQVAATGSFEDDPQAQALVSWTRTIDSGANDHATDLATTADGSVYVVGSTQASLDGQTYSGGAQDAFVVKYDAAGTKLWTRLLGSSSDDRATGIATNPNDGSIYIVGTTQGLTNKDIFVSRLSATGQVIWRKSIDSGADDTVQAVVSDSQGNVYLGGSTTGSLNEANAGGEDAFIARISENGSMQWATQGGTTGNDAVTALALAEDEQSLFITGRTAGNFGGQNFGGGESDVFVAKAVDLNASSYNLTLTLEPGQSSTTLTVAPQSDTLLEWDETVTMTVLGASSSNGGSSSLSATGTILNDDGDPLTSVSSLTASTISVTEGHSVTFLIATANLAAGQTLAYQLSGPGITASDILGDQLSGTAVVGADGNASFSVTLADDQLTEGVESLNVSVMDKTTTVLVNDLTTAPKIYGAVTAQLAYSGDTPVIYEAWSQRSFSPLTRENVIWNEGRQITDKIAIRYSDYSTRGIHFDIAKGAALELAPFAMDVTGFITPWMGFTFIYEETADSVTIKQAWAADYSGDLPATVSVDASPPYITQEMNSLPVGSANITGQTTVGSVLTVTNDITDDEGVTNLRYVWDVKDGTQHPQGNSYTVTAEDVGHYIYAWVEYTDLEGNSQRIRSELVTGAENPAPSLQGIVYDWKSHTLLKDVSLQVTAQADASKHLFELRNVHVTASGDVTAQVWVNVENLSAQSLDFDLALPTGVIGTFTTNATSLSGFTALTGDQAGHVTFGAYSINNSLSGSVLLGDLALDLPAGVQQSTVNFVSGSAGDLNLPAYSVNVGSQVAVTDAHGAYAFSNLEPGAHSLSLDKSLTPAETGSPAITAADALAALKLAVGRNPNGDTAGSQVVSPYQFIAADINADGKVTSADALAILQMVVKRSDAPLPEWLFVKENQDFWNETTGKFTTTRNAVNWDKEPYAIDSQTVNPQNFVAVLKADVNGSWAAPVGSEKLDNSYFENLVAGHSSSMQLSQWALQPTISPVLMV